MENGQTIQEFYNKIKKNKRQCDREKARELQLLGRGLIIESKENDFSDTMIFAEDEYEQKRGSLKGRWDEAPPPPPKLPAFGYVTAKARSTAIMASKAFPPCSKILIPALVASFVADTTAYSS